MALNILNPIKLRPSSLSKHKTNLYFKDAIVVNKEAYSLFIELIVIKTCT